jgi:hypothetical protein
VITVTDTALPRKYGARWMGQEERPTASARVTQTGLTEHVDLQLSRTGTRERMRVVVVAYTAIAMGVLGALIYVTVEGLDSWGPLLVIAGIVLATIGVTIAVDPVSRD